MPVTPFHLSIDIRDVNSGHWESQSPFGSCLASNVAIMSIRDTAISILVCTCRTKQVSTICIRDNKRGRISPYAAIPECGQVVFTVHTLITAAVVTCRLSAEVNATVVRCMLILSCQPLCVEWICCLQFIHRLRILYGFTYSCCMTSKNWNWPRIVCKKFNRNWIELNNDNCNITTHNWNEILTRGISAIYV